MIILKSNTKTFFNLYLPKDLNYSKEKLSFEKILA